MAPLTIPGCCPRNPSMKAALMAAFSVVLSHFLFHSPVSPQTISIPQSMGFILPQPARVC